MLQKIPGCAAGFLHYYMCAFLSVILYFIPKEGDFAPHFGMKISKTHSNPEKTVV